MSGGNRSALIIELGIAALAVVYTVLRNLPVGSFLAPAG